MGAEDIVQLDAEKERMMRAAGTYAKIIEPRSRAWTAVRGSIGSHLIIAACGQRSGTKEQRRRFLLLFASARLGRDRVLSELDCGTDLQAVRTLVRLDGAVC
jgi:alkylation response protein AidB-like acyl-CoA dehydrogenase